jgi:hypothetical protein
MCEGLPLSAGRDGWLGAERLGLELVVVSGAGAW